MSRRSAVARRRRTSASTASASASSGVTSRAGESGPCSAWVRRSAATVAGSAVASASTRPSDGPAGRSMPTSPTISILAAVTQALPGPDDEVHGVEPLVREPVGERADRLDAARDEQRVDVEQARGAEQDRVDVRRRGRRGWRRRSASDARDPRRARRP